MRTYTPVARRLPPRHGVLVTDGVGRRLYDVHGFLKRPSAVTT